jgi:predicted deacylase
MAPVAPTVWRVTCFLVAMATLSACATAPRSAGQPSVPATSGLGQRADIARGGWSRIGYSVERRPLYVAQSGSGPVRVYVIGGVHGDETEGRSMIDSLARSPNPAVTLRILRDLNPDGTAAGRRFNARGLDLNRNWPASNFDPSSTGGAQPLSEPETRALAADLRAFRPDIVVVLHSAADGPFVNYDGPAAALAADFATAAGGEWPGWYVRPDMGYATNGSLGSYLGVDQNIPILTIEFRQGQDESASGVALARGLAAVIQSAKVASR